MLEEAGAPPLFSALLVLAKPGIVAAVALSGFAGMVLGGKGVPEPRTACACLISLLMAAAGSAMVNSVLDARLDIRMARLQKRSAALAAVGEKPAFAVALLLICVGVSTAALFLKLMAVLLLLAAVLSYTIHYTISLKPRTPWAAVLGGVPGALPVLIGSAAVAPRIGAPPIILFLVMLLWQPPHFWLLALGHREEYRAAGIPVLPLVKGERYAEVCIVLWVALLLPASMALWVAGPCSDRYAAAALLLGLLFLGACTSSLGRRKLYQLAFRGSIAYLTALLAVVIADLCLSFSP